MTIFSSPISRGIVYGAAGGAAMTTALELGFNYPSSAHRNKGVKIAEGVSGGVAMGIALIFGGSMNHANWGWDAKKLALTIGGIGIPGGVLGGIAATNVLRHASAPNVSLSHR